MNARDETLFPRRHSDDNWFGQDRPFQLVCPSCGALVPESQAERHRNWHFEVVKACLSEVEAAAREAFKK